MKCSQMTIRNINSLLICKHLILLILLCLLISIAGCSKKNSILPSSNPPGTPYLFNVLATGEEPNRGMLVCIDGGFDNIDGFVIQRRQSGGQFTTIANINQNSANIDWTNEGDLIYVDWNNIGISIAYTYRVQAHNQDGSSDWSNEKTGTSAGPQSVTIWRYPTADAYVDEFSPDLNRGSDGYLLVSNKPSYRKISYLKFNYTGVPSYALGIRSVTLRLICQNEPSCGTVCVRVEDLAEDWFESSVTWNNRPSGRGILYSPAYVYNDGQLVYWDMKTIFTDWYDGVTLNHGIALRTQDNDNDVAALYSSEKPDLEPLLEIKYQW
jgi:hypothetical protein